MVEKSSTLQSQQFTLLCKEKYDLSRELLLYNDWKLEEITRDNVSLKSRKSPRDLTIFLGQTEVPFTPQQVFETIFDDKLRKVWDPTVAERRDLPVSSANIYTAYWRRNIVDLAWWRDFVVLTAVYPLPNGDFWIISTSDESIEALAPVSLLKAIRAKM